MELSGSQSRRTGFFLVAVFVALGLVQQCHGEEQKLQCYACGIPKVHPENDLPGSYGLGSGQKAYNHSCQEMYDSMVNGRPTSNFLRTCPTGVKSCFGARGFYDHNDDIASNDLTVEFLGCSEAKYQHSFGCDEEYQAVNIRDSVGTKVQVDIKVNLCFCSEHTCNDPDGELVKVHLQSLTSAAANTCYNRSILAIIAMVILLSLRQV